MRRTLQRLGEYLEMHQVANITSLAITLLGGAGLLFKIDPSWGVFLKIPLIIAIVVFGYIFYLILGFFLNDLIHAIGRRLIKLSKWYPEWYYKPSFNFWCEVRDNQFVDLYVASSRRNKKARLTMQFSGIRMLRSTKEEQYNIDLKATSIQNKRLFDRDIDPGAKHKGAIFYKDQGKLFLLFPNYAYGYTLDPGEYVYEFEVWGSHKGTNFDRYPVRVNVKLNEDGKIEA